MQPFFLCKNKYNISMKNSVIILLFCITIITTGAGYVGTLPDVESEFAYMKKNRSEKSQAPYSVEVLDKQNAERLKPVPKNDSSYIDIIIKRDKKNDYTHDLASILIILEKLRRCLNTNQNIQIFNAIVSNLIDNIEYVHTKYGNRNERDYPSYNKLLALSQQARETASFRTKSLALQRYMPYTSEDNIYTKENLDIRLENLLNSVNETIFVIKNLE